MSRDLKLYRLLTGIDAVIGQAESMHDGSALGSYTDVAALRQAQALARSALETLNGADGAPVNSGESRSSVTMLVAAKGEARFEVKAYTGSPIEPAMTEATTAFDALMRKLADSARVTEKEAMPV